MTQNELETTARALAATPDVAALAGPAPVLLLLDGSGTRVLWMSGPARTRWGALVAPDGTLRVGRTVAARLAALAGGAAPADGLRTERLRLGDDWLTPPLPIAFRHLPGPAGRDPSGAPRLLAVLAVAEEGGAAAGDGRFREADEPASDDAPEDVAPVPPPRRFVWSTDAAGRFTGVSRPLAEAVGAAAAILGRTWDDLLAGTLRDPSGALADAVSDPRAPWGPLTVWWRSEAGAEVAVDLAGMPAFGAGGELYGMRGYGLCHVGRLRPAPEAADRAATPPSARAPEPEADPVVASPALAGPVEAAGLPESHPARPFGALHLRVEARFGAPPPAPLAATPDLAAFAEPAEADDDEEGGPALTFAERGALREIARALGARLEEETDRPLPDDRRRASAEIVPLPMPRGRPSEAERLLDRVPVGLLVVRDDAALFANRALLDLAGYPDLPALAAAGGVPALFGGEAGPDQSPSGVSLAGDLARTSIAARDGERVPVETRIVSVDWGEAPAVLLVLTRAAPRRTEAAPTLPPALAGAFEVARLALLTLDGDGRLIGFSPDAERIFGYAAGEVAGETYTALFAPESHAALVALVRACAVPGSAGEAVLSGWPRTGEPVRLRVRAGRPDAAPDVLHLVVEEAGASGPRADDPDRARRAAEETSARQTEFLARVSHEIRTPVNAIIGFTELMLEERFGPVGTERYRGYLADIRAAGLHVVSLVNDLLDLAKVTSGKEELTPRSLDLPSVVAGAVAVLQAAASRERIVVRTSFPSGLPPVVADERSVRQIAINLMSNAIRFTPAGGQVIVSTTTNEQGDIAFRVRDTGVGMTPDEIETALQPFRQLSSTRREDGTGLGLPLSKALAEANGGTLSVTSRRNGGTLVEVVFPARRTATA